MIAVCVRDDDESAVGDQFCEKKRPKDKYKKWKLLLFQFINLFRVI